MLLIRLSDRFSRFVAFLELEILFELATESGLFGSKPIPMNLKSTLHACFTAIRVDRRIGKSS
jgi:hypothetical protein